MSRNVKEVVLIIAISFALTFTAGVIYVAQALDRNNEAMCEIFASVNEAPPRPPELQPTTPNGEKIAEYQRAQAAWQADFRRDIIRAVEEYDCR